MLVRVTVVVEEHPGGRIEVELEDPYVHGVTKELLLDKGDEAARKAWAAVEAGNPNLYVRP